MAELFSADVESAEALIAENDAREDFRDRQISRVPESPGITVRFASNPDPTNWIRVYEKWEPSAGAKGLMLPTHKGDINSEGKFATLRYLVNAVDTKENKPVVLKLAKTLVDNLLRKYNRAGTLVDRDWTLTRYGTGMSTEYEPEGERESERDLGRFEFANLKEVWQAEADAMADVAQAGPEKTTKRSLA